MRTLEERIKFDHGLPIGQSLVEFTLGADKRLALVEICENGKVYYFAYPLPTCVYGFWTLAKGDMAHLNAGSLVVDPLNNKEFMAKFSSTPAASIPVKV